MVSFLELNGRDRGDRGRDPEGGPLPSTPDIAEERGPEGGAGRDATGGGGGLRFPTLPNVERGVSW
jgi:hypothetical protein